ncbi:MAG: rhodanese-like domain-containing protein [Gammaproteobacteria bacterium]|nr:rhodanese-like domain-containing protein [Gammaproteobacteria bacterium]MBU2479173.1 rhodanese-like domain-containing protein [Gammaproteobacteria bacterium]
MQRETYKTLVAALTNETQEIMPWDLAEELTTAAPPMLLDIRCPDEFAAAQIPGAINVPRGILEIAVDYGYEETVPELVEARDRRIVVLCRSGNRSVLAAHTLRQMGYSEVLSLRTGLRGWNDFEQPLCNAAGQRMDPDQVDVMFSPPIAPEKLGPASAERANLAR